MKRPTTLRPLAAFIFSCALFGATLPAYAVACHSIHHAVSPDACDLLSVDGLSLPRRGLIERRIALPLNTTIDADALPQYMVKAQVSATGSKTDDQ